MSKSDTWETGLLQLVFENTDFTLVGDAGGLRGSATPGNFYVSLHTADPGEAGNQTTNETAYTNYARVAVARDGTGFTVTGDTVNPDADITFATCGATPGSDLTHFGIGTDSSGAGKLLYSGTLTPNVAMAEGVQPKVTTATAITEG